MQLSGYYGKTLYRNEKNGYTVFSIMVDGKSVVAFGSIPGLSTCTPITIEGEVETEGKYAGEFKVDALVSLSSDKASDIAFLTHVPDANITYEEAEDVCDKFPGPILDGISYLSSANALKKLTGLDIHRATLLYNKVKRAVDFKGLLDTLQPAGIYYSEVARLYSIYNGSTLEVLKKNPYTPCRLAGITFESADKLAKMMDIKPYSEIRVDGVLSYAIDDVISQGSMYAKIWEIRATVVYMQKKAAMDPISPYLAISRIPMHKEYVFCDEECVYPKKLKEYQDIFIGQIKRLYNSARNKSLDKKAVSEAISESGYTLAPGQKRCFNALSSEGVKIITGGPGRGKTTVINLLISYIKKTDPEGKICLMAPTGCAAQKMAENCPLDSETIHSRLGVRPYDGKMNPIFDVDNPMPYNYYIIDEFSMADIEISSLMFCAIPNHATVIIVGDPDQLPSVGAGDVLNDMINSGIFEVYELTDIFRQSDTSVIVDNAESIRKGEANLINGGDFSVTFTDESEGAVELCKKYIKDNKDDDYQLLCPIKKHAAGTKNMNTYIQSLSDHAGAVCKHYGVYTFYKGDSVITIRNNRDSGYFNGEPGTVKLIDEDGILIKFKNGDEIYVKNANLNEVLPSKALTVHKSQGNEYKKIILLITNESKIMLSRKILYTAITRAKEKVVMFCQKGLIEKMREDRQRNSRLDVLLQAII